MALKKNGHKGGKKKKPCPVRDARDHYGMTENGLYTGWRPTLGVIHMSVFTCWFT